MKKFQTTAAAKISRFVCEKGGVEGQNSIPVEPKSQNSELAQKLGAVKDLKSGVEKKLTPEDYKKMGWKKGQLQRGVFNLPNGEQTNYIDSAGDPVKVDRNGYYKPNMKVKSKDFIQEFAGKLNSWTESKNGEFVVSSEDVKIIKSKVKEMLGINGPNLKLEIDRSSNEFSAINVDGTMRGTFTVNDEGDKINFSLNTQTGELQVDNHKISQEQLQGLIKNPNKGKAFEDVESSDDSILTEIDNKKENGGIDSVIKYVKSLKGEQPNKKIISKLRGYIDEAPPTKMLEIMDLIKALEFKNFSKKPAEKPRKKSEGLMNSLGMPPYEEMRAMARKNQDRKPSSTVGKEKLKEKPKTEEIPGIDFKSEISPDAKKMMNDLRAEFTHNRLLINGNVVFTYNNATEKISITKGQGNSLIIKSKDKDSAGGRIETYSLKDTGKYFRLFKVYKSGKERRSFSVSKKNSQATNFINRIVGDIYGKNHSITRDSRLGKMTTSLENIRNELKKYFSPKDDVRFYVNDGGSSSRLADKVGLRAFSRLTPMEITYKGETKKILFTQSEDPKEVEQWLKQNFPKTEK